SSGIAVKDIAELMLESVLRRAGESVAHSPVGSRELAAAVEASVEVVARAEEVVVESEVEPVMNVAAPEIAEVATPVMRKKWTPKAAAPAREIEAPVQVAASVENSAVEPGANATAAAETPEVVAPAVVRKKWTPKVAGTPAGLAASTPQIAEAAVVERGPEVRADASNGADLGDTAASAPVRKKWEPKKSVKPPDSGE
ncbi:MAG: hypothetical protein ABR971_14000, partial [Acidobacteriaceae bacterium]